MGWAWITGGGDDGALSTARACGVIVEVKSKAAKVASDEIDRFFEGSEDELGFFLRIACVILLFPEKNGKVSGDFVVLGVGAEIKI